MHDHDFEKRVHQKMSDLNIQPSESVWVEVEKRLNRKNRRRWAILLPFLLFSLGLGGYLLYEVLFPISAKTETVIHQPETESAEPSAPFVKQDASGSLTQKKDHSPTNHAGDYAVPSASPDNNRDHSMPSRLLANTRNNPKSLDRIAYPAESNRPLKQLNVEAQSSIARRNDERNSNAGKMNLVAEDSRRKNSNFSTINSTVDINNVKPALNGEDSVTARPDALGSILPSPSTIGSTIMQELLINTALATGDQPWKPALPAVRLKKSTGWNWGLHLEAGRSGVTENLSKSIFAGGSQLSVSNNFGIAAPLRYPESSAKPGFGFSAGAVFTKKLSRRSALTLGLQYTLLTTSIKTGSGIDSFSNAQPVQADRNAGAPFYRGGFSYSYTNRYHFIELPVVFQAQLNRSQRLPFYWNAGVSVSRLAGSNALHYDNNAQVYFKNNDLMHKTQFNVLTGLSMRLLNKGRFQLELGPQVKYGFNSLFRRETISGNNILHTGLKANIFFK